jgi:aryl-alcohol dehydrogenase-like predicted oxidoreductase
MEYSRLGRTDIMVSRVCLGTMTFGEQNTEAEAHQQLDMAVAAGVTFIDTAEMYSFPARAETFGRSETIIGNWLKARAIRDKVVVATKITGPAPRFSYIRGGDLGFNRAHIEAAVDGSLERLQTDYVDLYQLHWPERNTNYFGRLGYEHEDDDAFTPLEDVLGVLADLVTAGKVRCVGLSNETPWGVMKFLEVADANGLPRVVGVQNPYNLLNRVFDIGLAEVAIREDCGLLAYAPLGAGTLTGKYLGGRTPKGARLTLFPQNTRYRGERAEAAVAAYVDLAGKHGLDPARMALAYVISRPFLTSAIIGATSMAQLEADIAAKDVTLSPEVVDGIEAIHKIHTYPCP